MKSLTPILNPLTLPNGAVLKPESAVGRGVVSPIFLGEPLHERAQEWQFDLFRLDLARIVALAVRTQTTGPLSLRAGTCLEL